MKELTKNRAELLRIFMTNPGQSFYMQEIGRMLGKKPGTFQRTINNMEKEGVLSSRYQGNARYFMANKQYPLYDEFKSIVFKTAGVAGTLQKLLAGFKDVSLAFIYGSYAAGRENSASDIDLVLVGKIPQAKITGPIRALEKQLNREINFTVYHEQEFNRAKASPGSFLNLVLKKKMVILKGSINVK